MRPNLSVPRNTSLTLCSNPWPPPASAGFWQTDTLPVILSTRHEPSFGQHFCEFTGFDTLAELVDFTAHDLF